jgi:hypothetical protein
MDVKKLQFIGLSKNCFKNLKMNIVFLEEFKQTSEFNVEITIIDSDSTDGTKDFCTNLLSNGNIDAFIEIDNLSENYKSRIERLTYCRNAGLKQIKSNFSDPVIYIPMDMDLELFNSVNTIEFEKLINFFIENTKIDCLLPFSTPYYYDIFALRKKGWVNGNALFSAFKLKKSLYLGSFLFNYFYIFRKQFSPNKFKEDLIRVESAFGGIGLYKINNVSLLDETYSVDPDNVDFVSEHLAFNEFFNNIFILRTWNIKAPLEHTRFKSSNFVQKFIYFLKTIKYDFLGLFNMLKSKF